MRSTEIPITTTGSSDGSAQATPEAYTIAGVAAATGIGRTKIYEEITVGRLVSFTHCGRRLILRDDLLAWLRASRDKAA